MAMRHKRRVLVVSYTFPPTGGAGVQRVAKFVKYLGRHGWEPIVLTVANPSVPVRDESLLEDIPAGTQIHGARSWEPGYGLKASMSGEAPIGARLGRWKRGVMSLAKRAATLALQPDPQILWYPGAVRVGKRLLKDQSFDAVLATAPPFTSFLAAVALARSARLPLIVDYRDEWTMCNTYLENQRLGPMALSIQRRMEHRVLRAASAVIATTESSAQSLRQSCRSARSSADVHWIYNGFDPNDFSGAEGPSDGDGCYRLVYTGTLWNLTSVKPLMAAVRKLACEQPQVVQRLELVFAGRRIGEQAQCVDAMRELPCKVVTHDYVSHSSAVALLHGIGANCLLLSDVPGAERVVPAKLFEYMASRRPILAILPRGETWDLLDRYSSAHRFTPSDTAGIAGWLATQLQSHREGRPNELAEPPARCFDREHQAQQLAEILNNVSVNAGF